VESVVSLRRNEWSICSGIRRYSHYRFFAHRFRGGHQSSFTTFSGFDSTTVVVLWGCRERQEEDEEVDLQPKGGVTVKAYTVYRYDYNRQVREPMMFY